MVSFPAILPDVEDDYPHHEGHNRQARNKKRRKLPDLDARVLLSKPDAWRWPKWEFWPDDSKWEVHKSTRLEEDVKVSVCRQFNKDIRYQTPLLCTCFHQATIQHIETLASNLLHEIGTTTRFSMWEEPQKGTQRLMIGAAILSEASVVSEETCDEDSDTRPIRIFILCLVGIASRMQKCGLEEKFLDYIEECLEKKEERDILVLVDELEDFYKKQGYKQGTPIQCPFPQACEKNFFVKGLSDRGKELVDGGKSAQRIYIDYESLALEKYFNDTY